jgi:glycosyltransferase involved in cell wall biosynthesis
MARHAMARREEAIVKLVDVIMVSSTSLQRKWLSYSNNVRLVRNGLDLSVLPELKNKGRLNQKNNVLGYVGTIAEWFDWDWLIALAEVRTEDKIQVIGPCFNEPAKKLPHNISLLPACDHKSALMAMLLFDVGLIPFKRSRLTDSVDPIKYYEYRALSLPVMSTNFGEMKYRTSEEGAFISRKLDDIADLASKASKYRFAIEEAKEFAQENTWEIRFDSAMLAI